MSAAAVASLENHEDLTVLVGNAVGVSAHGENCVYVERWPSQHVERQGVEFYLWGSGVSKQGAVSHV